MKLVTSKPVTENVKERGVLSFLKCVRFTPFPYVLCTAKPPKRGGGAEKKHNLKAAKAKQLCKTASHREMNKECQELFSDFSMNK